MSAEQIEQAAEVLDAHRWLTTYWRCACEPRDASHDVNRDTLTWHAGHLAQEFARAGLLLTEVEWGVRFCDVDDHGEAQQSYRSASSKSHAEHMAWTWEVDTNGTAKVVRRYVGAWQDVSGDE